MNTTAASQYMPVFFGIWISLMISSYLVFHRGTNAALKRKLWPVFMIVGGSVMVIFAWLMGADQKALTIMVPVVAFITIANIFTVKFCDCGKVATNRNPFSPARVCPHCSQTLEK